MESAEVCILNAPQRPLDLVPIHGTNERWGIWEDVRSLGPWTFLSHFYFLAVKCHAFPTVATDSQTRSLKAMGLLVMDWNR